MIPPFAIVLLFMLCDVCFVILYDWLKEDQD